MKALEDRLSGPLRELKKLATEGHEIGVYSQDIKKNLDSADHRVSGILKLRYLLVHAYDKKEGNPRLYQLWLRVLSEYGIPNSLVEWFTEYYGFDQKQTSFENTFRESHIPVLAEVLAECSGNWYQIGLSLKLPQYVLADIMATFSIHGSIVCLSKVLKEWIVGGYGNAKPPTVENLERALRSKMVSFGVLANHLKEDLVKQGICSTVFPPSKMPCVNRCPLEIIRQSRDLEVTQGKSTFIEVQVASCATSSKISFQWLKNGCQLSDDGLSYIGTKVQILCIRNALLASKGTYMCKIKLDQGPSLMSDPIILSVSVEIMVEKLIGRYTQSINYGNTWPPVSKKSYIDLLLIRHGSSLGERPEYIMEGDVDDFVKKEENLEYKEVFGVFKSGQFFLIEGRPGSGKTTLIQKLSRDWATGEAILNGAELVFVITLRMLSNRKKTGMVDILKFFYHNENLAGDVSDYIDQIDGKGVCFLIDGLDEYGSEEKDESLIFKIIRKEYLYHSMVIVASRPVAAGELRHRADIHVEVLGFSKKQIAEFVDNYPFTSPHASKKLNLYLAKHINILHMCYLPVHTAMICFLYDIIKENIPNTETEIYNHFTMLTVLRALKRSSKDIKLSSIEDLPRGQSEFFQKICELAFTMTSSSRQVFKASEVSFSCDSASDVPFLGLVTVGSSTGLYDYQDLYTFVHLTFQEYLAAYYISKLEDEEQMKVLCLYAKERHMKVVLKFYCGLASFVDKEFKFLEVMNAHSDNLFHCRCAFESQQSNICKCVVFLNKANGLSFKDQSLTASDFISINFVIKNASEFFLKFSIVSCDLGLLDNLSTLSSNMKLCNNLEHLDLSKNEIGDEGTEILSPCLLRFSKLQSLNFSRNEIGSEGMKSLACGLRKCRSLTVLNVEGDFGTVEPVCMELLGTSLKEHSNLQSLNVSRHSIGNEGVAELAQGIMKCNNLTMLKLDWNQIGDEGMAALVEGLKYCNNLISFEFEGNEITYKGLKKFAESLKYWSGLRHLNLANNELNDESVSCLFQYLNHCRNLQTIILHSNEITEASCDFISDCLLVLHDVQALDFQNNSLKQGAIAVFESLKHSCNFVSLNFAANNMGYDGSSAVANCLRCWEHLEELILSKNIIGDEGARKIAANLHYCSNITKVDLACNKVSSIGARFVAEGLRNCKRIETLHLGGNELGNEGADAIALSFKHWKLLKSVNLSDNKIGNDGVKAISANLEFISSSLEELNLSFNQIDDEGAEALAVSLKVCEVLEELLLNSNQIGDEGVMILAKNVKHCKKLTKLDVVENRVGGGGAQALVENVKLDTMDFSFCNINDVGVRDIAEDLKNCVDLLTLYLDHNQIGDEGAVILGKSLKFCSSLYDLYLQSNCINEEGAKGLALGLRCCDIRILHLEMNHIGDAGINSIAEGLVYCSDLERLYLQYNYIADKGAEGLAKILQACKRIEWIELQHNLIGCDGAVLFSRALKYGESLRTLPIYNNFVGDKGCAALAGGFKYCSNLESLNFAHNNIGDAGANALSKHLKYLHSLKEIYLGNNNISYVGAAALGEGLKYCSNLEIFNIEQNHIGDSVINLAKGLKHCSNLGSVDFEGNFISDIGAKGVAKSLKHCSRLAELNLRHNCILDEGIKAIAESLKYWMNLQSLFVDQDKIGFDAVQILTEKLNLCEVDFSYCNLDSQSCKPLVEGLKNCKRLEILHLNNNQINEDGLTFIAPCLKSFRFLKAVYLDHNCIDDTCVKHLISGLKCYSNIDDLSLQNNLIGDEGAECIGSLFPLNILNSLNLNGNRISGSGIEAMSKSLSACTSLNVLDLGFNRIGDQGAVSLTGALQNCKYLSSLTLDHNQIGDDGAKALSGLFQHCHYLIEVCAAYNEVGYEGIKFISTNMLNLKLLDLTSNSLGCKGVQALFQAIKEDTKLETLLLGNNVSSDKAIVEVLISSNNLKTLALECNRIGEKGITTLSKGLKYSHFLTSLILEHNKLNDECSIVLAEGVKHCIRLTKLSLKYNRIGDYGVKILVEALEHCYYLKELNLSSNIIGDDSVESLSHLLNICSYLEALDLRYNKITDKGAKVLEETGALNLRTLHLSGDSCKFRSCLERQSLDERSLEQVSLTRKVKFGENQQMLNLKGSSFLPGDMIILCGRLKNSNFLQILCLESCEIDDEKMKLLEEGLRNCIHLYKVYLHVNRIGDDGVKTLADCLENFSDLQELSLANNIIGDEGAAVLADSLKLCQKLTILDLERNRIGDKGAAALCESLKNCGGLKELNLEDNSISDEAIEALEDGFEHCSNLKLFLYVM